MNNLDLDAIEARYKETIAASPRDLWIPENTIKGDIAALIAEVRRLRAILNFAAKEEVHYQHEEWANDFTVEQIITDWANQVEQNKLAAQSYIRWLT